MRLLQGSIADWSGDVIVNCANQQLEPSTLPDYWRHVGRKDVNSPIHARVGPGLAEECAKVSKVRHFLKGEERVASAPAYDQFLRG